MAAFYNENDPYAAAWLRTLISAGELQPGDVDERSIEDIAPSDLEGYDQVHLFAGIGGWPLALQLSGWPDDRPVWTASCPCPPFSVAGRKQVCPACESTILVWCPRRTGYAICAECGHSWMADERHLWPEVWRLSSECRPVCCFGEQVESPSGRDWLAAVSASMEILGYAVGSSDLCAAGVGAPHIRQRLFWVADTGRGGVERWSRSRDASQARGEVKGRGNKRQRGWVAAGDRVSDGGLADAERPERREIDQPRRTEGRDVLSQGEEGSVRAGRGSQDGRVADADGRDAGAEGLQRGRGHVQQPEDQAVGGLGHPTRSGLQRPHQREDSHGESPSGQSESVRPSGSERLGDAGGKGSQERVGVGRVPGGEDCSDEGEAAVVGSDDDRMGNSARVGRLEERQDSGRSDEGSRAQGREQRPWDDCILIPCFDGKLRPTPHPESGVFPLAHGVPARVGRLRAYGNAIIPTLAAEFIRAFMND